MRLRVAELNQREKQAVTNSLVRLAMLARHSLTPSQTRVAARGVSELLWLLGIEEIELDGRRYEATAPAGEILHIERHRAIASDAS